MTGPSILGGVAFGYQFLDDDDAVVSEGFLGPEMRSVATAIGMCDAMEFAELPPGTTFFCRDFYPEESTLRAAMGSPLEETDVQMLVVEFGPGDIRHRPLQQHQIDFLRRMAT